MWYSTGSGRIELQITKTQARLGSHQGHCDEDIAYLVTVPAIRRQLNALDPQLVRKELKEFGAWSHDELQDHPQNLKRLLWIACGDICEQLV